MTKEQETFLLEYAPCISVQFMRTENQKADDVPAGVEMKFGKHYTIRCVNPDEREKNYIDCLDGLMGVVGGR